MGRNLPAVAFFVGLALGDDGKVRALVAHWAAVSGRGGSGLVSPGWGYCANVAQTVGQSQFRHSCCAAACGASLVGVLMLRFFILYAGS